MPRIQTKWNRSRIGRRNIKRTLAALSLVMLLPHVALAQSTTTQPAFEMADVHPSTPGAKEGCVFPPGGRFECQGATMLKLIATAYSVSADLVLEGPDWLGADRFDITAKAPPGPASPEALLRMLQTLLADRFGLAVHDEREDVPVYLLTVGKKGPRLQPAANPNAPDCPTEYGVRGLNHSACNAFTMADLCRLLPVVARNYVDHPVVDMTGLAGAYDFELNWMGKFAYVAAKANSGGRRAVSMFDAIEKLGLKLELGMHPMAVILIDNVNRDSINRTATDDPRLARETPAVTTEFEVAEVRPSKPGATERLTAQNGRLEILGYTLRELITMAFDVKSDAVTGGPKWLETDRFDVIAKSPDVMSPRAMSGMLKALIVQRFKLQIHNEDQPMTVFALALGNRSPKLKATGISARSECKLSPAETGRAYVCQNTTMAQLAERLPDVAGAYLTHSVVDLTGLKGAYDFTLTWTPRARLPGAAGRGDDIGLPALGVVQASTPAGDLTVFEAIDEQLGLKLDERKLPMPVIVIDHVERIPAGNQ
jgi:uncharacterized protein (TIGR03435 family)